MDTQIAVPRDALADNRPCFSYVDMKVMTDNLLQTSVGDNSPILLAKLRHTHKDRKSELRDTDCIRKVDSCPSLNFPILKAHSAAEAMSMDLVCP